MYLGLQKPENKAQEVSAANPQLEACGAVYIKQTVRKVMHKNRHSLHFYVVEQTVCKRSAHDVTLKREVILCLLHDAQIRTNYNSCNMFLRTIFVFAKPGGGRHARNSVCRLVVLVTFSSFSIAVSSGI